MTWDVYAETISGTWVPVGERIGSRDAAIAHAAAWRTTMRMFLPGNRAPRTHVRRRYRATARPMPDWNDYECRTWRDAMVAANVRR